MCPEASCSRSSGVPGGAVGGAAVGQTGKTGTPRSGSLYSAAGWTEGRRERGTVAPECGPED